jgi:hypothetical protein
MPRIDLNVPFSEKDEAKRQGARWDGDRKVWFIPDGGNPIAFKRWLIGQPNISIWSNRYFIAQTATACWKCGRDTNVFTFILPNGHEILEEDEADEAPENYGRWVKCSEPTIVSYITDLLPSVSDRVKPISHTYHLDFSKTINSSYWMNHCKHCGMKQGDFELHCEPSGAFFPMSKNDALQITLHEVKEPFGCNGSSSYGDMWFDYMREA